MNHDAVSWIVLISLIVSTFSVTMTIQSYQIYLRRIERKLDALLKHKGVEWTSLSREVQCLAQIPGKKIAAIQRHRELNPDISLAEAKDDVESFRRMVG